ncbi:glycosyl hydrolase family 18 protein [Bacteroidota bacterium]
MNKRLIFAFLLLLIINFSFSQHKSIHQEQSEYYQSLGEISNLQYDSINDFKGILLESEKNNCSLEKVVFGYHPYWAGSAYLNYQWNLLSDMCFFSYDVDAATGLPLTTYNFLGAPAVDSALANGTKVHLCLTLFSSHSIFLNNPTSVQTLIDEVIYYVSTRNAHGVNIDFELVSSSLSTQMMDFISNLSVQVKSAIPDAIISIALPAVDWGQLYDIPFLNNYIDYYMIMAYEYHWQGSSQAGAVSPLYGMVSSNSRSVARTASDYQHKGMPEEKIVLGLPYFGRQWKTDGQMAPANTLATGTAHTYESIMNNGAGFYNPDNLLWEPNSFSPYYSFYNNAWYQCFHPSVKELGYRYDLINYRSFAGLGIWALSYDDGYTELWQLIEDKFTDCSVDKIRDTIFDSGGPAWNYYNDEEYLYTIRSEGAASINLWFEQFELEDEYDSLWIYDGPDNTFPLLAGLSGNTFPALVSSSGSAMTIQFYSDHATTFPGWTAIWEAVGVGVEENMFETFEIYPNPAETYFYCRFHIPYSICSIWIYDVRGEIVRMIDVSEGNSDVRIDVSDLSDGVYFVGVYSEGKQIAKQKLIVF